MLAGGEVTAHADRTVDDGAVMLTTAESATFVRLARKAELVHEEHAPIELLGRKTWQIWPAFWPTAPAGELTDRINAIPKYVVSSTLERGLERLDHHLRRRRRAGREAEGAAGGDMVVYGSPDLVDELLKHDLLDEYRLLTYHVILGSDKHLFRDRIDMHPRSNCDR